MPRTLTGNDAKQSLSSHVAAKGAEVFAKYGPDLGWKELQQLLEDRALVRYPCELVFEAEHLNPGEFAHAAAKSDNPEDGFTLYVHPFYMVQLRMVPYLVLYQLVVVNYGAFASADDAETFGSHALGISKEEYYETLCELADQLGAGVDPGTSAHGGGGCGCGGH